MRTNPVLCKLMIRQATKRKKLLHEITCLNFSVNACSNVVIEGNIKPGGHGISVGDYAQIKKIFTTQQVQDYGKLISDENPIHGGSSSKVIVHGMLSASVFSSIFGTLIPGSIYRSQKIYFNLPIFSDEYIIGRVQVIKVKDLRKGLLVTCDTIVYQKDIDDKNLVTKKECVEEMKKCVQGVAEVWLPGVK